MAQAQESNIVFSRHAVAQMAERKISHDAVIETLKMYKRVVVQSDGRKRATQLVRRNKKNYALVVIYSEVRGVITVVTVFMTSKLMKYFK